MNCWVLTFAVVGAFLLAGLAVLFYGSNRFFATGSENDPGQQLAELANQPTSVVSEKTLVVQPASSSASGTANSQAPGAGPGWAVNCKSQAKEAELECRMSQTVVFKKSGQVLTNVTVRVPNGAKPPVILVRLPLGLYLPAGATYQIDENAPQALDFRACVRTGCYAQTSVAPDVLANLKAGKRLTVGFQNVAQKPIKVQLSLDGFGEAYDKLQKPS